MLNFAKTVMIEKFFQPKNTPLDPLDQNSADAKATFWDYLKSREFFISFAIIIGGGLLLIILILTVLLPVITNHNRQTEVPDVTGLPYRKAVDALNNVGLEVEVGDSVYKPELKPLTVDYQEPAPLSIVKPGRTVFLRVNKVLPPMVKLPSIKDESLEHAKDILTNWKLKIGNITYVPSSNNNLVVGAFLNGKPIEKDTPIPEGAKIDLKVSKWLITQKVPLPDLVGKDFSDADREIKSLGLFINPLFIPNNSAGRKLEVYRQDPRYKGKNDSVTIGTEITIFVNNDGPPRFGDGGQPIDNNSEGEDVDNSEGTKNKKEESEKPKTGKTNDKSTSAKKGRN